MALRVLYRGHADTLNDLKAEEFTRQNYGAPGMTSSRITADTPNGVLAGMVACMDTDGVVRTVNSGSDIPVGIFASDAQGPSFENTPAIASGKIAVFKSQGVYETDIYETRNEANTADLTYQVGDKLYPSKNGLRTKDSSTNDNVVGIVTKSPGSDGWLRFDLRI